MGVYELPLFRELYYDPPFDDDDCDFMMEMDEYLS